MKLREGCKCMCQGFGHRVTLLTANRKAEAWPFMQMEPFSALSLALAWDPSKRKLRSDPAIWQGQEEVLSFQYVCPRAAEAGSVSSQSHGPGGTWPCQTLLCIPVLPLPSLREPRGQARGQLNFRFGATGSKAKWAEPGCGWRIMF